MKEIEQDKRAAAVPRHFRVLVVDDNEMDRKLTVLQLGEVWPFDRDLAVECAGDGAEALEKLSVQRFALIVVDWTMPRMDGGELLRAMRRLGLQIPVVVVSGHERAEIDEDIESLGASFVNKEQLAPASFRSAIAASIKLQGLESPAGSRTWGAAKVGSTQHAAA